MKANFSVIRNKLRHLRHLKRIPNCDVFSFTLI